MKRRLSFSLSMSNGEADISPASEAFIHDLISDDPLLAADLLKDIHGISGTLYEAALTGLHAQWAKK